MRSWSFIKGITTHMSFIRPASTVLPTVVLAHSLIFTALPQEKGYPIKTDSIAVNVAATLQAQRSNQAGGLVLTYHTASLNAILVNLTQIVSQVAQLRFHALREQKRETHMGTSVMPLQREEK